MQTTRQRDTSSSRTNEFPEKLPLVSGRISLSSVETAIRRTESSIAVLNRAQRRHDSSLRDLIKEAGEMHSILKLTETQVFEINKALDATNARRNALQAELDTPVAVFMDPKIAAGKERKVKDLVIKASLLEEELAQMLIEYASVRERTDGLLARRDLAIVRSHGRASAFEAHRARLNEKLEKQQALWSLLSDSALPKVGGLAHEYGERATA